MPKSSRRPGREDAAKARKAARRARKELEHLKSIVPAEGHPYERKLRKAFEHLEALKGEVARWSASHPYEWDSEFVPARSEEVIYAKLTGAPLDDFADKASDSIHNLRAALDNLAFALAETHHGRPLPEKIARASQFPVFGPRAMSEAEENRLVGALHPEARAIIEQLQPFKRGKDYEESPLWVLHELERIDKHRFPLTATANPSEMSLRIPAQRMADTSTKFVTDLVFDGRTEVASFPAKRPAIEKDVDFSMKLEVVLGAGSAAEGHSLIDAIEIILTFVLVEVARPLKRFL